MATDATFDVEVIEDDASLLVRVAGDVDLATSPRLREALERAITAGIPLVRLDMNAVTFLDSSGISVLVDGKQRLADDGARLVLHGVGERIARVLEISGLGSFFDTSDQPAS